jgi:hypothetical protein
MGFKKSIIPNIRENNYNKIYVLLIEIRFDKDSIDLEGYIHQIYIPIR